MKCTQKRLALLLFFVIAFFNLYNNDYSTNKACLVFHITTPCEPGNCEEKKSGEKGNDSDQDLDKNQKQQQDKTDRPQPQLAYFNIR